MDAAAGWPQYWLKDVDMIGIYLVGALATTPQQDCQ